jgi:hypothetical protein
MLPQIVNHAKFAFRNLRGEARQDCIQETIANALVAFVALVRHGKMSIAYPSVLAKYATAQINEGRLVTNRLNVREVLSPYAQRLKNFKVERLDIHDKDDENTWCEVLVEDRRCGPAQIACTRIDFESWLHSLSSRHRRLAQYLSLGHRTSDAAKKFKITAGRVSQVRRELAKSWRKFVGDDDLPSSVPA